MKRVLVYLSLIGVLISGAASGQDFILNNPIMTPTPATYPNGTLNITFDFYVTQDYTFSSDDLSSSYASVTFSFTKMDPSGITPSGTGAELFDWVLTNNGGTDAGLTYTWSGKSKAVTMAASPPGAKYKITFANVPVTMSATATQPDIRLAGEFTSPTNSVGDNFDNNFAQIATYSISALPVSFKSFDAKIVDNSLVVNWTTATEKNNDRFQIQIMKADSTFETIGEVLSKAKDNGGNSDIPLEYTFTKQLKAEGSLMGLALSVIGFVVLLFNRKNKLLCLLVIVCGITTLQISCRKEAREDVKMSDKELVRVVQLDNEGGMGFSKVAVATRK